MKHSPLCAISEESRTRAEWERHVERLEAEVERGKQAEIAYRTLKEKYEHAIRMQDLLSREVFAIRNMLRMPELLLDEDFHILGHSDDFPAVTRKLDRLVSGRRHLREFIGEEGFRKIEDYLQRIESVEKLPFDQGGRWKLRYQGPGPNDSIGGNWIPYHSSECCHWRIEQREGGYEFLHQPHPDDLVNCFLMTAAEYGGAEEDLRVVYRLRTPRRRELIRDLSLVISGSSGEGSIDPDLVGYAILTASNSNREGRIQKKSRNILILPENLEPDTDYEVQVERIGGRIQKTLRSLRTGSADSWLMTIDTDAIYDGHSHVGLHTFCGEARFREIEIHTRRSRFSIDQFKIPLEIQVGIEDELLRGRVFKLRLGRDVSLGRSLYMLLFEDITRSKEAEAALRRSEEKFRELFEKSGDAMSTTTVDGRYVDFNQALLDLIGYTREELLGINAVQCFVDPEDRRRFTREVEKKGFVRNFEIRLRKKNGAEIVCLFNSAVRRNPDGSIWGYQTTFNDITDRKRLVKQRELYFGSSPLIRKVRELVRLAADSGAPVTLLGETGSGKGLLAQWIHDHSVRNSGPFVEINCSGLRAETLASELFGHTRGAFTTAVQERKGLIQVADGGTLFLDEIGEMPMSIQADFLKVIEEKQYRRMGEDRLRSSDFRLICSTNKDLFEETRNGRFRPDLYFRIQVFPIHIPPLRRLPEDLPGYARFLLEALKAPRVELSGEIMSMLQAYAWPGNIRELRNVLERALLLSHGDRLTPAHFPGLECFCAGAAGDYSPCDLRELERSRVLEILEQAGGNKHRAAEMLGISRATLYRKLR